jgi:hypothetical protein
VSPAPGRAAAVLALLCGAVLAAGLGLWNASLDRSAGAVLAVPAGDVAILSGRTGCPSSELWRRLQALGVSAALMPGERLSDLAADGRILSFSRAEWEKWGAMGLVAPGARMRPGTLWVRDAGTLLRVAASARAAGTAVSTSAAGGFFFLEFPDSFDWASLPAGIALDATKELSGMGLAPALAEPGGAAIVAGRRMESVSASAGDPVGRILRLVHSGPDRLVVWRLSPGMGVEENVAALREVLRSLRSRGWPRDPASVPRRPDASWEWPGKLAFGLIALAGPLLAARCALAALKGARPLVRHRVPLGSPVLEFAAGLAACWGVAALAGLAARFAAQAAGPSLDAPWRAWALAGPLTLGAVSLWPPPWTGLARAWRSPLTPRLLAGALLLGAAAYLCVDAGADPGARAAAWVLDALSLDNGAGWWLPGRWREVLAGWPCLLAALTFVDRGWSRRDAAEVGAAQGRPGLPADPRPWLLAGLLGPASLILRACDLGVPWTETLTHSLAAAALGAVLGALARAGLRASCRA